MTETAGVSDHEPPTFLSAAVTVLRGAQEPLNVNEITDSALRRGLLSTAGKTSIRSMSACLYLAVKDDPQAPLERVFEPGARRARRGSVRWRLKEV
jgi:hypothetical protein